MNWGKGNVVPETNRDKGLLCVLCVYYMLLCKFVNRTIKLYMREI
jgi:hypothetical protein